MKTETINGQSFTYPPQFVSVGHYMSALEQNIEIMTAEGNGKFLGPDIKEVKRFKQAAEI